MLIKEKFTATTVTATSVMSASATAITVTTTSVMSATVKWHHQLRQQHLHGNISDGNISHGNIIYGNISNNNISYVNNSYMAESFRVISVIATSVTATTSFVNISYINNSYGNNKYVAASVMATTVTATTSFAALILGCGSWNDVFVSAMFSLCICSLGTNWNQFTTAGGEGGREKKGNEKDRQPEMEKLTLVEQNFCNVNA